MTYVIEKNIPLPASSPIGLCQAIRSLGVGDSFVVSDRPYASINGACQRVRSADKTLKFAVRRLVKDGPCRVWRVA